MRSFYQCLNAKVHGDKIICSAGKKITPNGFVPTKELRIGNPLEFGACQICRNYDEMGPPIPPEERGWADFTDLTLEDLKLPLVVYNHLRRSKVTLADLIKLTSSKEKPRIKGIGRARMADIELALKKYLLVSPK